MPARKGRPVVCLDTGEGAVEGEGEAGADGEVSGRLLQVKALGRVKVWPSGFLTVIRRKLCRPRGPQNSPELQPLKMWN